MANPTMQEGIFQLENQYNIDMTNAMTLNGTIMKALFLLLLVCVSGSYTWMQMAAGNVALAQALMMVGLIVGFILAMIIAFARKTAPYLAPIYAIAEGFALGGISAMYNAASHGIVFQAVTATFAVMFVMLGLYLGRVIRVTDKLRAGILIATISIAVIYLVAFILSFFKIQVPFLFDATPIGIAVSVVVIIVAAANLLLDFDIIEKGVASYAPKYFEWYCGFGLLVTLVWLYLEILRLLSKLQKR